MEFQRNATDDLNADHYISPYVNLAAGFSLWISLLVGWKICQWRGYEFDSPESRRHARTWAPLITVAASVASLGVLQLNYELGIILFVAQAVLHAVMFLCTESLAKPWCGTLIKHFEPHSSTCLAPVH